MGRSDLLKKELGLLRELEHECGDCEELVGKIIDVVELLEQRQGEKVSGEDIAYVVELKALRDRLYEQYSRMESITKQQRSAVEVVCTMVLGVMSDLSVKSEAGNELNELLGRLHSDEDLEKLVLTLSGQGIFYVPSY